MKFSAGTEGKREASALHRAVCEVGDQLRRHELPSEPLEAELKEIRFRLSVFLYPVPIDQLDRQVKEDDEKFPDWVHGYTLAGRAIIWHSRPRSPDHPLWDLYPH